MVHVEQAFQKQEVHNIYKKATTIEIRNHQKQQAYHTATKLCITEPNREAPNKLNKIVEGR